MQDSWHGDNKPAATPLGRAVDRVLTGRCASAVFLVLGYAYAGWQIWLAIEWVRSLS